MKHFIAFVTLGIAAIGSGMALAAHFAMPEPSVSEPAPSPSRARSTMPTSRSTMPSFSDVDLPSMPAMPRSLPAPVEAVNGAGRAFGKATDTMAYYSDRAFGPTARKVKRSVDQAELPTVH